MSHTYHTVDKELGDVVRSVIVIDSSGGNQSTNLPLVTSALPVLIFTLEFKGEFVSGISEMTLYPESCPETKWKIKGRKKLIAFFFQPFTISALFNISISKLKQKGTSLEIANSHVCNSLKTQILSSKNIPETLDAISHFLLFFQKKNRKTIEVIHKATDAFVLHPEEDSMSDILHELKISERTLQRMFKKHIGITPTYFRRICQYKKSFSQLKGERFEKISDVAFENGYADQSHFNRAFREFSSVTPLDYLRFGLNTKKSK